MTKQPTVTSSLTVENQATDLTNSSNCSPLLNHLTNLHTLAEKTGADGQFVCTSFGEDPITGKSLCSQIAHFQIGQILEMETWIEKFTKLKHRNVYLPPVLMRPDLPKNKKSGEKDIVAVLGLVADFDDANASQWNERIPLPPSYVLETSPGRFQVGFWFDRPLSPDKAKPIAKGLKNYCKCDHGTADISHVWRLPGTLNWPNKKKVDEGRAPEPWEVQYVEL